MFGGMEEKSVPLSDFSSGGQIFNYKSQKPDKSREKDV